MSVAITRIQSMMLAPHLMVVVPDMDLNEFAIQLWPGTLLNFRRSYVHGAQTGHFVATEIVSDNAARRYTSLLAKGVLLPGMTERQWFEEVAFYPASPDMGTPVAAT